MKRMLLCICCLALMMPFTARAQDRGEISVFGGYSASWEVFFSGARLERVPCRQHSETLCSRRGLFRIFRQGNP